MARAWILVGGLVACHDGSTTSAPAPAPDRDVEKAGSTTITPRPSLPVESPAPTGVVPTIQETFEHEPVDRFWRTNTEAEIRHRLPSASEIECHQTLCRITMIGNEHELAAAVDLMETEASLRGIARSIMLTAPDKRTDGTFALRAYARFDHEP